MSKGQLEFIAVIFGILILGIGIILFSISKITGYLNVRVIVEENQAERHAIILAQVFSSLPNLTYSDGQTFYRAVFEKKKIDDLMIKQPEFVSNWQENLYPDLKLSNETGYPDSYSLITLLDLEANENWIAVVAGPQKKFKVSEFVKCLINNKKGDIDKLFEAGSGPWNVFDIDACVENFNSLYDVTVYYSKTGTSFHGFPVSIRISEEEIHSALLRVWVAEV